MFLLCICVALIMQRQLFKCRFFYCHMHSSYSQAVIGNEILNCQAPPNNAQTIFIKMIKCINCEVDRLWTGKNRTVRQSGHSQQRATLAQEVEH